MKHLCFFFVFLIVLIPALQAIEGDVTSPEFHYITVSPEVIANGDSIKIVVKTSDNESEISSISVVINNPSGTQATYINGNVEDSDPEEPHWENTGDSLYEQSIKLNEYAINGTWYVVGVWVYDEEFNSVHTSHTDSVLHEFTVNSTMGDDEPPVVSDFSFSTDTALNGDSVKVYLKAADAVAGLDNAFFMVYPPSGMSVISFNGSFIDPEEEMWDSLGGDIYSTKIKVSDFAESGDWVAYLRIDDKAGNSFSVDGLPAFYVKSSTPDLDAPTLAEVVINPDTVTLGDEVELLVNAHDDVSGLAFIQLSLRNSEDGTSGNSIRYGTIAAPGEEISVEDDEGGRKWEFEGDDWYSNVLTIPDTILAGWFHVTHVRVRDTADNSHHITLANKWDSVFVKECYFTFTKDTAICEGESYYAGGSNQTVSGIYYDTLVVPGACDTIVETTLEILICTSLENTDSKDHLIVYPNPASGIFWFRIPENLKIDAWYVYDISGSLLMQNLDIQHNKIDISNYPAGLYSIRFVTNKETIVEMVSIEKQ